MTPLEKAATALTESLNTSSINGDLATFAVIAVLKAIREPSEEMLAAVVRQVGDPSPENWAAGEKVSERLGGNRMMGEMVCAELARDWQAMIDTIINEGGAEC